MSDRFSNSTGKSEPHSWEILLPHEKFFSGEIFPRSHITGDAGGYVFLIDIVTIFFDNAEQNGHLKILI